LDDLGKVLRLRGAIRGAIGATEVAQATLGGDTLARRYASLRAEAPNVIPTEDQEELIRLLPLTLSGYGSGPRDLPGQFNAARIFLGSLGDWLGGYVERAQIAAQIEANAEAYAQARLKEERGVGFRASIPAAPSNAASSFTVQPDA